MYDKLMKKRSPLYQPYFNQCTSGLLVKLDDYEQILTVVCVLLLSQSRLVHVLSSFTLLAANIRHAGS